MEILQGFGLAVLVFILFFGGGCVISLVVDLAKVVGNGSRKWILNPIKGFGSSVLFVLPSLAVPIGYCRINRLAWCGSSSRWLDCFDLVVVCFSGLLARSTGVVGDVGFLLGFVDQRQWLSLGKITTWSGRGNSGKGPGTTC